MIKILKAGVVLVGVVLMMVWAGKDYFGIHYYYRYQEERSRVRSVQSSFVELESLLRRAEKLSANPKIKEELGRLYLEMAVVENEFGTPERRDAYLDESRETLVKLIRCNPIDVNAYYMMGYVYLLYNYPLLTYSNKAKLYFKKALDFKPADEFLNLNVLYVFLAQWDFLEQGEKSFVAERLQRMQDNHPNFIRRLRDHWKRNFGPTEKLDLILDLILRWLS